MSLTKPNNDASPRPWSWDGFALRDAEGRRIAWVGYAGAKGCSRRVDADEKAANMALIVELVNAEAARWNRDPPVSTRAAVQLATVRETRGE